MASATAATKASPTTAVESASTAGIAVESSTVVAVEGFAASVVACVTVVAVRVGDWAPIDRVSSVVASVVSVAGVVPGACSDEDSTGEPAGAVVAVGGAGVGRVVIVAVRAGWRAIGIARSVVGGRCADAYADRDLSVRERSWESKNTEQREIA
jgi:hypothetical protein